MDRDSSQLPWDALRHKDGDIPWDALRTFAETLVHDPNVVGGLFDLYAEAHETAWKDVSYGDLYVPAIFTLAAPNLDDEQRRRIGIFLIDKLVLAGREADEFALEVLTAAAGAMGPAILPDVLDAIEREADAEGAWLFLWNLTLLAAKTEDADLRRRVVQACVQLLERVERGEVEEWEGINAAWTLAKLKCTEQTRLLERVAEKTADSFEGGDYREALLLLQEGRDYTPVQELWEKPVEEWLTLQRNDLCNWYMHRHEEPDEDLDREFRIEDPLVEQFLTSPVGRSLPPELLNIAPSIIEQVIDLSFKTLEVDPLAWDEGTLRELLLDVLPRRAFANEIHLAKIAPILEAFILWLGSEGLCDDAQHLAAAVHGWSDAIVCAGMNPDNWSPHKAMIMQALKDGRDITDPAFKEHLVKEQMRAFLDAAAAEPEPEPMPNEPNEPPIPIVSTKPGVGRNDPCPCGSGRKYKKCCGSPSKKT
ncbi:MAG TPA: SEC-C metal-binding domain-containing protein [Sedimentisphaerales bacterium]|nr:SEC-C metal-binding domain-containing protein [Sedimentisphaerales bacterium]HRS11837.1 SEC-C metal-binding domain-containing protein [Sedimentisphaerales bacterium]HRV48754.1 SEC-C metal-binding domain-containing protein [Sedimentisphaerales bacterium]